MRHGVEAHERPSPGASRSQTSRPWAAQSIRMTNINIVSDDLGYLIRCARPLAGLLAIWTLQNVSIGG